MQNLLRRDRLLKLLFNDNVDDDYNNNDHNNNDDDDYRNYNDSVTIMKHQVVR